jgi:SAM-dependent methyltransferase
VSAAAETVLCPVCGSATSAIGSKIGARFGGLYFLRRCPRCTFAFVANPNTDYAAIYDEAYYSGQGSDPMVDYASEYSDPAATIRLHDWEGIRQAVTFLRPKGGRWLDYGCGNGGLVRSLAKNGAWNVFGYDTGAWAAKAQADGLPILTAQELTAQQSSFDVISAVEVLEHVPDPVGFLRHLRGFARPDTLLFLTTMNALVAPRNLAEWSYVQPELHVSFFTPLALATALQRSGFKPFHPGFVPGWGKIIRFKVLKNLGVKRNARWHSFLPWPVLARLVDARYRLTQLPLGIAV